MLRTFSQELEIRDLEFDDLEKVKEIRDSCLDYLDTQVSYTIEQTREWFREQKPLWYAVTVHGKLAGYIRTSDRDYGGKSLQVGMDLHEDYRGKKYADRAYTIFLNWLAREGFRVAYLKVQVANYRAYRLYRKHGFLPCGVIPDAVTTAKGETRDSVLMYKNLTCPK